MMPINNNKAILEQLSFHYCADVNQICKPIFDFLNVDSFHFRRYYPTIDESIYLFTNPIWAKFYIDKYSIDKSFVKKKEIDVAQASKSNLNFLLWKYHFSHLHNYKVARDVFDIDNGIAIIRKYDNYTETYHLATTVKNTSVNEHYMENIEPILKFLDYFVIKSQEIMSPFLKIIANTPQKKIDIPKNYTSNQLAEFYKSIEMQELPIMRPNGEIIYLSKREVECLKGIAIGLTAKDIAKKHLISFRTVQQHLERVRHKTEVTTCTALLTQLYKDPAIRAFLLKDNQSLL